jgi:glutamate dehydrogenase
MSSRKQTARKQAPRKQSAAERSLLPAIARELADALLPGDEGFGKGGLDDAARFVLAAAMQREAGEPVVAIESVTGPVDERLTRIAVINDNMPFLVDSVAATITDRGLAIDRLVHPVVSLRRDKAGRLIALPQEGDAGDSAEESVIYIEAVRADARTRVALRAALDETLAAVRAAVADWPQMQAALATDADGLEQAGDAESGALLRWFRNGMLTQLGHVRRGRDGRLKGALGVCRRGAGGRVLPDAASFARAFAWFDATSSRAPLILKSDEAGHVHRCVPSDIFVVPEANGADGRVTGLSVHVGLWTSAALAAPPAFVPGLRAQLSALTAKFGFDPRGHDGKALVHALTTLPHDLLIAFGADDLERVATAMMALIDRPRPRLLLVRAPLDRHLYAFVWLPRDALSTAVRRGIQDALEAAATGPTIDWTLAVEGGLAVLRFVIDIPDDAATPDEQALDAAVKAMVRGWPGAVEAALIAHEEPRRAAAIAARYAEAFPLSYRSAHGPTEAATDIACLRRLDAEQARGARLHVPVPDAGGTGADPGRLHLKLYQQHGALELSDAVPMLENFGFRVAGEDATLLENGALGAIHDFALELPAGVAAADLFARAEQIDAAIAAVLNGAAEDDAFNRLIVTTGLAAHEANWLRAWYRYLRQATLHYGIATVVDALQSAPAVTRGVIDLFLARHDPGFSGNRERAEARADAAIRDGLAAVGAINDDRLLRQYRALVEAMLRSNAFVPPGRNGHAIALAFKIDSAALPGCPRPLPWREIFVYSRRVEGIHLRAGPVARGGLRWSDRRDDFRTEVLGLMKAQRVKNAVIVPTGAKGGFYPKQLPDPALDRDGWLAEGKASYQHLHAVAAVAHRQYRRRQGRASQGRGHPR